MIKLTQTSFVNIINLNREDEDFLTQDEFEELWNIKPHNKLVLNFGGKDQVCPRYCRNYIRQYKFNTNNIEFSKDLPPIVSRILDKLIRRTNTSFNQCLLNWYEDDGYIGYHSDDTKPLIYRSPIASYSYMKTDQTIREFALKNKLTKRVDAIIPLKNNTLVIMEGSCQETHLHSALRSLDKIDDGRRINITFRCFKE